MKYKYKNLKHVTLHGILPYGVGEFDHEILGGGIELIKDKKIVEKKIIDDKKIKEIEII